LVYLPRDDASPQYRKKQAEARQYDDEQDENCQGGENHGSRAGECADKPDADEVRRGSKQAINSCTQPPRCALLLLSCLLDGSGQDPVFLGAGGFVRLCDNIQWDMG
jgi:hypothetical protein